MRIKDLAAAAGCEIQTIRHYEREGLLPSPPREPSSGYRRYGAAHLARLRFIRLCRHLDMPLADVRRLLDWAAQPAQHGSEVHELLDAQITRTADRLRELQALQTELMAIKARCDGVHTHPCGILDALRAEARA
jgi:DNA-binding transcriptional MerR regulator